MSHGKHVTTTTGTSLLDGLRSPDNRTVWDQFTSRFRPVVLNIARRRGLKSDDAEDAAQRTMMEFFRAYREGKYDRSRGRLRHWLFGIARRQISNVIRHLPHNELQAPETTSHADFFDKQPDPADDTQLDEIELAEWQRATYRECFERIRGEFEPRTIRGFELFALKGIPAAEVAEEVGMPSPNAVFVAKSKIMGRFKELLSQVEADWS